MTSDISDQSLMAQSLLTKASVLLPMVEGKTQEQDIIEVEIKEERMFLRMALYPKVSKTNILTLFLALFANRMVLSFALSFIPLLLIDVYNVPKS